MRYLNVNEMSSKRYSDNNMLQIKRANKIAIKITLSTI